ncbi:App1 family protein [Corynebacterium lubricantis]|uniref:App1 family protein n=1 Tax=Corynebacterium lubricantis TaxID=541095 RepID=UPI0003A7F442|nr:phosphatase domain-containing protein [Corynebacterium lubricantis]
MGIADVVRGIETRANRRGMRKKSEQGWVPEATGYTGYGSSQRAHVLGRVLMAQHTEPQTLVMRGYRQFFTTQVPGIDVLVRLGDAEVHSKTNANGYIDVLLAGHNLEPGWHEAEISVVGNGAFPDQEPVTAPVHIIADHTKVGLISDIDDTIIVTMLPRAALAAWNSWVKKTNTRQPIPGMDEFYAALLEDDPNAPVFYISTGAWNTYDTLVSFIEKHHLPRGPLLLTDWGPTPTGLFRSGQEHKKVQIRNLFIEFPEINWILIGDDGQHDPLIYGEAIFEHPDRIKQVAIRRLSPQEHVLSHGTTSALSQPEHYPNTPTISGRDGHELLRQWRAQESGESPSDI